MPFDGEIDWTEAVRDLRSGEERFPVLFELRDYGPDVTSLARLREVMVRMDELAQEK